MACSQVLSLLDCGHFDKRRKIRYKISKTYGCVMPARLPPLNWLRAFEASARALSFTAAAQELNMTQSAVSQHIKSLENALGRPLFVRRVRGLELTDGGRGYLPTVQAAFAMLEEGTSVLTGRNDPDVLELHVNLSFAIFWLTPRLGRFMAEFPWVQLNVATSIWAEEKPNASAAVEIVLGQGKWESRVGKRLTWDTIFPVCTPEVAARIHTVDDLLKERLFDLPGNLQSWDSWLEACPRDTGTPNRPTQPPASPASPLSPPPVVHRASTWAVSLAWAQSGLGVALAHDTVASHLIQTGRLVRPLDFALPMKEAFYLIAPEGTHTNAAAQAFKGWLLREMAAGPGP
ncbi:MAG: Gcv operon activator [Pseudomonadota bacterium]